MLRPQVPELALEAAAKAANLVPITALGGAHCGAACEVCPLRPWKSARISGFVCTEILSARSAELDGQRIHPLSTYS